MPELKTSKCVYKECINKYIFKVTIVKSRARFGSIYTIVRSKIF